MRFAGLYKQYGRARCFQPLYSGKKSHFVTTATSRNYIRHPGGLSDKLKLQENFDNDQHAKLAYLLEQGCQIWEAAEHLKRPRNVVKDYILSNPGLYSSLKPFKEGAWSRFELDRLEYFIWNKDDPRSMARSLGRKRAAVRLKARNILIAGRRGVFVEGRWTRNLADLPGWQWDEDAIMQAQVEKVWAELMKGPISRMWRKIISKEPGSVWVYEICSMMTPAVKSLLIRGSPPTVRKLQQMPWVDTDEAGVYARLWRRKSKHRAHITLLYVGAALFRNNGLRGVKQHLLDQKIRGKGEWAEDLPRGFTTLMVAPNNINTPENADRVRHVLNLGKILLSHYLGAMEAQSSPALSPWQRFPYKGSVERDPLNERTTHLETKLPAKAQPETEEPDVPDDELIEPLSAYFKAMSKINEKLAANEGSGKVSKRKSRLRKHPESQSATRNHLYALKRLETKKELNK